MTIDGGLKPEGAPERSPIAGAGAPSGVDAGAKRYSVQRKMAVSMARRISLRSGACQNSPVWRAGISRRVERRLHCWAAFRDVLVWTE